MLYTPKKVLKKCQSRNDVPKVESDLRAIAYSEDKPFPLHTVFKTANWSGQILLNVTLCVTGFLKKPQNLCKFY